MITCKALELALEQLPQSALDGEILARSDSAGASHAFAEGCRETRIQFSLGYAINETVREQILSLSEEAWRRRSTAMGTCARWAWFTELTGLIDLSSWPVGTRLICCRERPTPARSSHSLTRTGTASRLHHRPGRGGHRRA